VVIEWQGSGAGGAARAHPCPSPLGRRRSDAGLPRRALERYNAGSEVLARVAQLVSQAWSNGTSRRRSRVAGYAAKGERLCVYRSCQEERVLRLFEQAAQNAVEAAEALAKLFGDFTEVEIKVRDIHASSLRRQAQHEIVRHLNETFVTPLDREDIVGLASKIDDITDVCYDVSELVQLFKVKSIRRSGTSSEGLGSPPARCYSCSRIWKA